MSKPDESGDNAILWPAQAATQLGVTPRTLQRWAESGKFPSIILPSGRRRFRQSDVDALLTNDGARETADA